MGSDDSSFVLPVGIPRSVKLGARTLVRDEFYDWLWQEFREEGLQGVHEGTMLSEEAAKEGHATDSWTVDSGEAPRERDWVSDQSIETAELYFAENRQAENVRERLSRIDGLAVGEVREQKAQDWDAQWKASFTGASIPPYWRILPPWVSDEGIGREERVLRINPGAGFGTGTHETTQLCLQAISEADRRHALWGARALDFGSGSGILSIGLALLGAQVDAVEIDPLANDNAAENARLNDVLPLITIQSSLEAIHGTEKYSVVVANILRPVLLEFADRLVERLKLGGTLVLSGLIEKDVPEVSARYEALLGAKPEVRALGDWRALVWWR